MSRSLIQRLPWKRIVFGLLFLLMSRSIAQTVTSPPATKPRPADAEKAKREVVPPNGGADYRLPLSGAGLVSGNGLVEPVQREANLSTAVPGVVAHIRVKEGDRVVAGTPLVELASEVEQRAVAAAEADVAAQRANFARLQEGQRPEDREALEKDAAAALKRAELDEAQANRIGQLSSTGAVTKEDLDKAVLGASESRARAQASEARAAAARNGSRSVDVAQGRAALASAQAKLDQARASLSRLTLRAPADGEILDIKVRPGEYFAPGSGPMVILGDTSRLRVRMEIDERDLAKVKAGSRAYVLADAFGDTKFSGTVSELARRMGRKRISTSNPTERQDTQIREVLIDLDQADGLISGLRVTGYVESGAAPTG